MRCDPSRAKELTPRSVQPVSPVNPATMDRRAGYAPASALGVSRLQMQGPSSRLRLKAGHQFDANVRLATGRGVRLSLRAWLPLLIAAQPTPLPLISRELAYL
jgi:hypothetical protein